MNQRDSNFGGRRSSGYRNEDSDWETSRQDDRWQDESSHRTGSGWGNDDDQRSRYSGGRYSQESSGSGRFQQLEGRRYGGSEGSYGSSYGGGSYGERSHYDRGSGNRGRFGDDYGARGQRGSRFSNDRGAYPSREYDASGGNDFADFTSEDYGGRDFYARRGGGGGGMSPSFSYRPTFDTFGRGYYGSRGYDSNDRDDRSWREYGEERGFFQRAGDEIASWFGDEDAARRREEDHRGRGPSDYTRSDERIREDVNDRLTQDWKVDATNIRVTAKDGEVTLEGTVGSRNAKRRAEDVADDVTGVKHVQNNLRVTGGTSWTDTGQGASFSNSARTGSTVSGTATGTSGTATSPSGTTTGSSSTGSSS
ncbi:MAG: hypothetical protein K0R64_3287 [Novosphingobium lindaniclasticum]|jgi:hypothetical protein|uniref:BON domain-containing protein n=1 Tax=Novosphingobium lindaniclasticum TaxID=1329895 RepID=UPI00240980DD|nr:BON domain-containing protein [Novosphingobium lindaniclasticum]MDF2640303.1 hypothetical protein [Novosphingobium lindaniclasticum]